MARDISGVGGNRLNVGDVADIDITGTAITISAWVWPDALGDAGILGKSDGSASTQYFLRFLAPNKLRFAANAVVSADSVSTLSTGIWQHVGGQLSGSGAGASRVIINGAVDNTATDNTGIPDTAHSLLLGTLATTYAHMDGALAEVGIWDVALDAAELAALGKGFSPACIRPQSLKGYWPLLGNASPEPDLKNGNGASIVGTVNKATIHPRIIVPRPAIYLP